MARSDTRYSVYPTPRAIDVVGNSAPALNQAIECWAALLTRAMADNSNNICPWYLANCRDENELNEWCVLAEALRGKRFDPEFANPGDLLAAAVEDADRFFCVGDKWFTSMHDGDFAYGARTRLFRELVKKLHDLDPVHAWAVIIAVQWFWDHQDEGIDMGKDLWWTLAFRRQWKEKHASKQDSDGMEEQQPEKEGRKRKRRGPSKGKAGAEGR